MNLLMPITPGLSIRDADVVYAQRVVYPSGWDKKPTIRIRLVDLTELSVNEDDMLPEGYKILQLSPVEVK